MPKIVLPKIFLALSASSMMEMKLSANQILKKFPPIVNFMNDPLLVTVSHGNYSPRFTTEKPVSDDIIQLTDRESINYIPTLVAVKIAMLSPTSAKSPIQNFKDKPIYLLNYYKKNTVQVLT